LCQAHERRNKGRLMLVSNNLAVSPSSMTPVQCQSERRLRLAYVCARPSDKRQRAFIVEIVDDAKGA
jgi:hypothetical protein